MKKLDYDSTVLQELSRKLAANSVNHSRKLGYGSVASQL